MSSTPIEYRSTDASAPTLAGNTSGSLNALLRAILVNGYSGKTAAGWTEPFAESGNVAVFRNNSSVGNGAYFRINDNALDSGKTAAIRGYMAKTDVTDAGTDPFPTTAQESPGLYIRKTGTASSAVRSWWALACRRWIYLGIDSEDAGLASTAIYFFGDIESLRSDDIYHSAIIAGINLAPSTAAARTQFGLTASNLVSSAPSLRNYFARNYGQAPGSTQFDLLAPAPGLNTLGGTSNSPSYPHPVNNGLLYSKVAIKEAIGLVRGYMPNFYTPWHDNALTDLSTFTALPPLGVNVLVKHNRPTAATVTTQGDFMFDVQTTN